MGDPQPRYPGPNGAASSDGSRLSSDPTLLQRRIEQLEAELREAKALVAGLAVRATSGVHRSGQRNTENGVEIVIPIPISSPSAASTPSLSGSSPGVDYTPPTVETSGLSLHLLLILSDSALPLGSFAFSSGLESYLTHHYHKAVPTAPSTPPSAAQQPPTTLLRRFLSLSLSSLATTTLPFITAAYNTPNLSTHTTTHLATSSILNLNDIFDATTTCPVLRRASTTQGKALLSIWKKSLHLPLQNTPPSVVDLPALIASYHHQGGNETPPHFPIAWALISLYSKLTLHQTTFVFLLNHTKALLSAAVRLNIIGPYVAQKILAAPEMLEMVRRVQEVGLSVGVEEAGQTVPTMDLYQGRHELLYSRVFNS